MQTNELGQLEVVDVRAYWKDEARDFTPWLAENIHLLSEAVGLDLSVEEQESKVGVFSADIVCLTGERTVIVENQFGKTDHDHLGKLLTYASGKNATVIVWLAEDFRDEHRATMDWLNKNTSSDIHVFGVQIGLVKIGNSPHAPLFTVVSQPNDWAKTVRHIGEMNDTQKLYFNFWTDLQKVMEQNKGKVGTRAPLPASWVEFSIGRSEFYLSAIMRPTKKQIEVRLVMQGQKEVAKAHYHLLYQQKDEVEREIGQKLTWLELPNNKQSQVRLLRENCDVTDKQQWGDFHSWLHEYLEKFHAAFHKRVRDLNAEDWSFPEAQDENNT